MAGEDIFNGMWIGSTLSPIELLTLHSFLGHGHRFRLWVYNELTTKVPDEVELCDASKIIPLEDVFSYSNTNQFGHGKGSFAGFSDIFRYKLLLEKGGWWVDMDISCLEKFPDFDSYFFRKHHDFSAVGNIIKCPGGSELMEYCYHRSIKEIHADNRDWHKPIQILNDGIKKFSLEQHIHEVSNQDMWPDLIPFLLKDKKPKNNWHAIHWMNEMWRSNGLPKDSFAKNAFIHKLFRKYDIPVETRSFLSVWYALKVRSRLQSFKKSSVK